MIRRINQSINPSRLVVWVTLIGLIVLVLLPTFYLISYVFINWGDVWIEVFDNPIIGDENWRQILKVLFFSFRLSLSAVAFDLIFGVPLAYVLARKQFPGKGLLEDIITLPLVIPTSGFGFATLITWTSVAGIGGFLGMNTGVVSLDTVVPIINVPLIVFIVHVALTFPYIVRTLQTKIQSIDTTYETAARTLGANPLTTFRNVLLPLVLPGIFSGAILAFARSLGETGATLIVAGVSSTASIAIVRWTAEFKLATAAFMGSLLVIIAWTLILPVERYMGREKRSFKTPYRLPSSLIKRVMELERYASKKLTRIKDFAPIFVLVLTVIVPIIVVANSVFSYWSADPYTGKVQGGVVYQLFGPAGYFNTLVKASLTSIIVALVSTYVSTCIAMPLSFIIVRRWYGSFIRSILKIPLIVPTSSLGLSVLLLWGSNGFNLVGSGIWLIILTHIAFSVPVIVESILASYEGSDIQMYEDSARTLGATAYNAIETVSLPLIKGGVLTGFILSFAHSLGETGATYIVMGRDITVPALVVNMVEALAIPAALFTSTYLIVLSMILLTIIRFTTRR
ncbi:MAG: ABC transporter permease subunit [Candidatus Bathyarchaeota archaeon]|nr:ABC transporter permease subunit [Candidatus Bathyarchaeota archaeon]